MVRLYLDSISLISVETLAAAEVMAEQRRRARSKCRRHNPSHDTHVPRLCSFVNTLHFCVHSCAFRRFFTQFSSIRLREKRKSYLSTHLIAPPLPRHSDGHCTPQGSYSRRDPRKYTSTEEPLGPCAERSTFGYQAESPPSTGYEPNLYHEDTTSNLHVSISDDAVQMSATSSETEDAATALPAESLFFEF